MNKVLFYILLLISNSSFACGGISIENETSFQIWTGYDLSKLRLADAGTIVDIEKRQGRLIHIKSIQQNCQYRDNGSITVKPFKDMQFEVYLDGKKIAPETCQ